ncbi:MAG: endonuclease III domain-containing protein [Pseudomonadota bacterium]
MRPDKQSPLLEIYDRLVTHFGPSHWWPGESPLEIMVGAILTQNTSWNNVERAIERLKIEGALSASFLNRVNEGILSEWIRSTGYYRIKAKRLKNFFRFFINEYQGLTKNMQDQPLEHLRRQLLQVNGIGPETADSILLYALERPIFVVDAYTHRILSRHQLIDEDISYEDLQAYFMDHLPSDPQLYNEYHALLVRLGKEFCQKKNPRCQECPLKILSERP